MASVASESKHKNGDEIDLAYNRKISLHFGISNFEDDKWASLENGEEDALRLQKRFKEHLHFDQSDVVLGSDVTAENFHQKLGDLASDCEEDDLVVITWHSHGQTLKMANGKDSGYLVPFNAPGTLALSNTHDFINMRDVTQFLDENILAKHVVLLLDCCSRNYHHSR